jgi:adenylate cyclase
VALALQCDAGQWKAGPIGKEADAAYALCEQALAIDPNNVRALQLLGIKFYLPVDAGVSGDPKGDLERADELETKALALDPDNTWAHLNMGNVRRIEGRIEEAVAEAERALALAPSNVDAVASLGYNDERLGEFGKSLEYLDKAIQTNPYSPSLAYFYGGKAVANFGLKNYDQAIDWARQAIAIRPDYVPYYHATLVAALALTGRDAEAREALQRYLALPSSRSLKTIAAWKAFYNSQAPKQGDDPRFVEMNERVYDGLRKAGMPEGDAKSN